MRFTLGVVSAPAFTLHLHAPAWAAGATLAVNGEPIGTEVRPGDWLAVSREWAAGDVITLTLPMRVRLLEGNPHVEATRNQVAVQRGPIVYCLESTDLPEGVRVDEVFIPRDIALTPRHRPDLLNGVTVLEGEAVRRREDDWSGTLYRDLSAAPPERVPLTLIPYYAWNNRGEPEMTIWMPVA